MYGVMQDWMIMGIMFAGTPAMVLARRWDAVAAGITVPRAAGPAPAPQPARRPDPRPVIDPVLAPAPAYLRLCRVDECIDAERRAGRREGMVRAGY